MKIKEMFSKPIDRSIEGVIKVEDEDQAAVKQEIEEYIVTKELEKHFKAFFESYKKGIVGTTNKNGVWISGFFGSGKSHFLKMLSYLLENKKVNNKTTIEYFEEDKKITDKDTWNNILEAAAVPTDVILFNIDAKADQTGKNTPLVYVFLKVFNEMRGFYGNIPQVADMEEELTRRGEYERFKTKFEEISGEPWETGRNSFDFIQDDLVETLVEIGFQSEEAARNWCEKATGSFSISIEDFAEKVNDYITSKGGNHHVIFLVDEVGQFIGDNREYMLNLQTIQEELGSKTKGKAWIVVTSQEDIDSLTKVIGDDFSKIQGRFDTRLSLTSSNADEVIKKRILKKNQTGTDTLRLLYGENETNIKNEIHFEDTPEMKLYSSDEEFAEVYPFVPYQFNLLSSILTSIRRHGASGKHLSEGERSLLSLFKESAEAVKEEEEGRIIPLYAFYDALESFLDSSHARIISQAASNNNINPNNERDNFNVNVLKTLFLIKYVNEMENSNVENITSLMISDVNEDRLVLKKNVEKALGILVKEALVEYHNNRYIFLTEEEQEIGREISRQDIDEGEIIDTISEEIFDNLLPGNSFKSPYLNGQYNYPYNRSVDGKYKTGQSQFLTVQVITPYSQYSEENIRVKSGFEPGIIIMLPENITEYYEEYREAEKIKRYLGRHSQINSTRLEEIKAKKRAEEKERRANAKSSLQEALKHSRIFAYGNEISSSNRDIKSRFSEAMEKEIENIYPSRHYITKAFNNDDILHLLNNSDSQQLFDDSEPNKLAKEDISRRIIELNSRRNKVTLKSLIDQFTDKPYGFTTTDIAWIIASLLKEGRISLSLNGETISLISEKPEVIVNLLTKSKDFEKITLTPRRSIPEVILNSGRTILKEVFGKTNNTNNEEELFLDLKMSYDNLQKELNHLNSMARGEYYPGRNVIQNGLNLIEKTRYINSPEIFFNRLQKTRDDWLDFAEDIEYVRHFYDENSFQKEHFDKSIENVKRYYDNKSYIDDIDLDQTVENIREILEKEHPYKLISKLPNLNKQFEESYDKNLKKHLKNTVKTIERDRKQIHEILSRDELEKKYQNNFDREYDQIISDARNSQSILSLKSFEEKSSNTRQKQEGILRREIESARSSVAGEAAGEPVRIKKVSLSELIDRNSWEIRNRHDLTKLLRRIEDVLSEKLDEEKEISFYIEF